MVWGAILAVLSVTLLNIGGLRVIQTSAVIVSVPIFIIYLLLIVSFFKWLKQDFPKQ